LIDRHPDTRFIIDHLGIMQPHMPPAPPQPWADLPKVLELARRLNAVIKVSGACTLSREPYPFSDIWDSLARVFDAWGFDRCLWAAIKRPHLLVSSCVPQSVSTEFRWIRAISVR
jgi:predicted TIM-barrel fold metal-dependent hydrolase